MKPGKHQRNKDAKIQVGRSMTRHNLLFCPHTLCMSYVTNTFLLVRFSERSKQPLYFVHRQGQKSEQKHKTKNFVEFHNHCPLLTLNRRKDFYQSVSQMTTYLALSRSVQCTYWSQTALNNFEFRMKMRIFSRGCSRSSKILIHFTLILS